MDMDNSFMRAKGGGVGGKRRWANGGEKGDTCNYISIKNFYQNKTFLHNFLMKMDYHLGNRSCNFSAPCAYAYVWHNVYTQKILLNLRIQIHKMMHFYTQQI